VVLPVAAYAVDATVLAGREAGLQAATAQAAESGAQQLNVGTFRSSGAMTLDSAAVSRVAAQTLMEEEPGATVEAGPVVGTAVTLVTRESVTLPFSIFAHTVTLRAHATARLAAGFESPSAPPPQPTR
jgi:hypothetical protein